MTTPNEIGVRGTVAQVTKETTKSGKPKLTLVIETRTTFKGQDYFDYYPIVFWERSAPKFEIRQGDLLDVEFRVGGSQSSRDPTKYFVNLTGVSAERVVADDAGNWRPGTDVEVAEPHDEAPWRKDDGAMPF